MKKDKKSKFISKDILRSSIKGAFAKLNPVYMVKNPVMFVVEVGFVISFISIFFPHLFGDKGENLSLYKGLVAFILFVTLVFANFAESVAEGRGKAQAETLKKTKKDTKARLVKDDGSYEEISANDLKKGDIVLVKTGEIIPNDGEIIEGIASIDESAITGESAPVTKEKGGDFSSVTGGTKVVSDWIKVEISSKPGESFLDKMISLVEGASRQKTPNEIALNTLLVSLTIIFLIVIVTLYPIAKYLDVHIPISTLVVCVDDKIYGVIYLKDTVKPGLRERFERLKKIGIKTIMCTGDNPLTAATIAAEAGVDGYISKCKPEDKIEAIKKEQSQGKIVAMTCDGTNDAPALAQADVGIAMNSGTSSAKEAANMVDLDSDPTKILEVVEIGKQLLITRGSLTTFSISNDIAKYFAIIPAMFTIAIPKMEVLNIMGLSSPSSAIISALIFNAIIIPCLIPLAMRGIAYKPMSASKMLGKNMLIYGLGGIICPFIGIKLIDILVFPLLTALGI